VQPVQATGAANGSDIFVIASFRDRRIGYPEFVIPAIRHRVDRRASIGFVCNCQACGKIAPLCAGGFAID
jgi:hypothetical protein